MQSTELKQIFPQHIQHHLSPIDLINLIQVSRHLSSFVTTKTCSKIITTRIKKVLERMFGQDLEWFLQIMQEHNMALYGRFIFDCVLGREVDSDIEDLQMYVILDNMSDELARKLDQKEYKYNPEMMAILFPFRGHRKFQTLMLWVVISPDRDAEKMNNLDIQKNFWCPGKLYVHKLFDICTKEMSYDNALSSPWYVMKYYNMGFKFTKDGKVLTDVEVKNGLLKFLDIEYYDRIDHRIDERIQEYLKRDAWYAMKEPIVWSSGDNYVVRRSTGVYKKFAGRGEICNMTACINEDCLFRFVFPGVEHHNHYRSFTDSCETQSLVVVNGLV